MWVLFFFFFFFFFCFRLFFFFFFFFFFLQTLFETFEILWEVMTEFKLKHEHFKDTTVDQYLVAVCENIGLKTRWFFFVLFSSLLPLVTHAFLG